MTTTPAQLPVTLLTGFLGSGKTTLLNRLVRQPEFADCVVIVNEFGEIGIDHLLIEHVEESMRILDNGCVCCTVRGDLIDTLVDLAARRERGELQFARVVIETTGLADPAPIVHSLTVDPSLTAHWGLQGVVTTVDAVNGAATLSAHAEAARQAGLADVLLITKTDLAGAEAAQALRSRLRALNPQARLLDPADPALARVLLGTSFSTGWRDAHGSGDHSHESHDHGSHDHDHDHGGHHHHDISGVRSHCLSFDAPVDEAVFAEWLEVLAAMRGENLLRVKGLVAVASDPERPRIIQCVQHVVHPVTLLEHWPSDDRRTRLVFIVQHIDADVIDRSFKRYGIWPALPRQMDAI